MEDHRVNREANRQMQSRGKATISTQGTRILVVGSGAGLARPHSRSKSDACEAGARTMVASGSLIARCLMAAAVFAPTAVSATLDGANQPNLVAPLGERQPLFEAVRQRDAALVIDLLAAGADPDQLDPLGRAPLHYAASMQLPQIVAALLQAGADPNPVDGDGLTPLHRAVQRSNAETVRLLVEAGADAALSYDEGPSPIDLANEIGDEAIIAILEGALH